MDINVETREVDEQIFHDLPWPPMPIKFSSVQDPRKCDSTRILRKKEKDGVTLSNSSLLWSAGSIPPKP